MNPKAKTKTCAEIKTEPRTNRAKAEQYKLKPSPDLEDFPPINSKQLELWLELSKLVREPLMDMKELKEELKGLDKRDGPG